MALIRLLLLCCMVASEVWDAATRPIDFVCDKESRRAMNTVAEMEVALVKCNSLTNLSSPVQLACIKVHKASWENKPREEKKGDIVASLGALVTGVRAAGSLAQPGCGSALLKQLEHSINNYLHILTHLNVNQGQVENPLLSCFPQRTRQLSVVLWNYGRLIASKVEWLMADLTDRCPPQ